MCSLQEKIEIIAKEMYGAASVDYLPKVGLRCTSISPCALEATAIWIMDFDSSPALQGMPGSQAHR